MEAGGAIDSAHRVKQMCGQICRYAVATGSAERDMTVDLKGALSVVPKTNYAAITEPETGWRVDAVALRLHWTPLRCSGS